MGHTHEKNKVRKEKLSRLHNVRSEHKLSGMANKSKFGYSKTNTSGDDLHDLVVGERSRSSRKPSMPKLPWDETQ